MKRTVQLVIPLMVLASIGFGIGLPMPKNLPAVALGSQELLWAERSLALFYGLLLLVVPLLKGLQGQIPIELSARGARWVETTAASEKGIDAVNAKVDVLAERVAQGTNLTTTALERIGALEDRPPARRISRRRRRS